jgi:hypothetical protein
MHARYTFKIWGMDVKSIIMYDPGAKKSVQNNIFWIKYYDFTSNFFTTRCKKSATVKRKHETYHFFLDARVNND